MKRSCSGCTLCCKLLPVRELDKGANQRCQHQRTGKGCAVYRKPAAMPFSCHVWNCRWLYDDATIELSRPDRSHYVIDVMPDYIEAQHDETGYRQKIEAVQIWVDPDYPDAHRDPALRRYLETINQERPVVALVRYGSNDGLTLIPPSLNDENRWIEHKSQMVAKEHTFDDMLAFGGIKMEFIQR